MKTLLIPTDFDLKTLNSIPGLADRFYPEKLNIILVHMMKITDSITELLTLSRRSSEYRHISQKFDNTCTKLKERYADQINYIRCEFFYGNTVATLNNYLDANEVDAIILFNNYEYKSLNKYSVEPQVLLNRSGKDILTVDCKQTGNIKVLVNHEILTEQTV